MIQVLKFNRIKNFFSSCLAAIVLGLLLCSGGCRSTQTAVDVSHYPANANLLPGKGPATSWKGLPAVWAQREAQFAKTAAGDYHAVVFLGDSITQGWTSLAKDFPNLKVANRGIGGDTTRGVLYRLDADVLSLDPQAIVLLIGTNDIGNGANPADVADNIRAILKAIRKEDPEIPVIVCEVMPSSAKMGRPADKIEKLNALIQKEMKNKPNVYLCDTWSIFADANGNAPHDIFHDLLHPNAAGYAKWEAALNPILAKLDLKAI
ncbi:MAG TPA: GDSL-type esterase/lipase family protein [Verrucomicrobiae bacterium]|jgi:beta-glucosidase